MRILLLLLAAGIASLLTAADPRRPAGRLEGGYRLIRLDPRRAPQDLVVYRGDYVLFTTKNDIKATLSIPDLDVEVGLPMRRDGGHITFRSTGTFDYFLNGQKARIVVVEFVRPGYHEIGAREAAKVLELAETIILDVRTPMEHTRVRIPQSRLIPLSELRGRLHELKEYRDRPVLVYCATGNRSTMAAQLLLESGFRKVYNLRYGIREWIAVGFPVEP